MDALRRFRMWLHATLLAMSTAALASAGASDNADNMVRSSAAASSALVKESRANYTQIQQARRIPSKAAP